MLDLFGVVDGINSAGLTVALGSAPGDQPRRSPVQSFSLAGARAR